MAQKNNIQDFLLNTVRKERIEVTIYLTSGVPLKGRVISFDNFTIVLQDIKAKQSMIYKHAISTIIPEKPISFFGDRRQQTSKLANQEQGE